MSDEIEKNVADFLAIASPDGDIYRTFTGAYLRLQQENAPSPALFREGRAVDGECLQNPSILGYLGDAVKMYQRCPEKLPELGLLFAPSSSHIKALRHAIDLLEDGAITFQGEDGARFKGDVKVAASMVKHALEDVWEHVPSSTKRSAKTIQLDVQGYSANSWLGSTSKRGEGFVQRHLKDRDTSLIEVSSAGILPHLLEYNALLRPLGAGPYEDERPRKIINMHVIKSDGSIEGFNDCAFDKGIREILINSESDEVASYARDYRRWHSRHDGIDTKTTQEDIEFIENTLLPYVCKTYPFKTTEIISDASPQVR